MLEPSVFEKINSLPTTPGIYIYKDTVGKVLYVGKAKNTKNRVRSYFTKSADLGPAKERMMGLIANIETISTDTELEALVLEANLIRKHQPPYNVLLRDDKYYLFIKITKEEQPRIFPVRKIINDGARYFGPYSSAASVRATLRLLRRIFPFKGEKDTAHDIIFPHPLFGSPPFQGGDGGGEKDHQVTHPTQPPLEKGRGSDKVVAFLKGQRQEIIKTLEDGIAESSKNLEFERAALFRDQLQAIMRLEGFQKVYLPRNETFDVISIARDHTSSAANVLQIREGKLLGKQTFLLHHRQDAILSDIVRQFLLQYYSVAQDIPKEILIPCPLEDASVLKEWIASHPTQPPLEKGRSRERSLPLSQGGVGGGEVTLRVPKRGIKRQLLAMGETNAKILLQEQGAIQETKRASKDALETLLQAIGIDSKATVALRQAQGDSFRIETYDISNIQGTLATASMVVFEDGMPAKDQYRKFRIQYTGGKTLGVNGQTPSVEEPVAQTPNDFAMLEETLTRRLAREDWPLPNLIIIDGGKGQLSSAQKSLKKSGKEIPMISIAKREEEIFLPGKKDSIVLPYDSPALYLIQRMRDEAHRFTITYHRKLRGKEQIKSVLDEVPGIGPKTKKLLIQTFGSVKGIKDASDTELEQLIGKKKTATLREHL
ncbi:MAG: hypothetical protein A3D99_03065 [Candidatus Andersenbacteria bacterium RIFCSPHIGHO2_12_FULL_45_11]|uniref:UvrABC system protein C n=1 Tax=Candidatus Andersenbacteria bacterium RIFCSPHIGHO2_12_FULL_45_11 TaxID=1797281 RepID=A0A1G1WZY7_9BACT|nr:MAG: hypothetical protein A3D99_03065 [Candidatus Andersenbacteria bacterium RIFCSPHIGHO2_12_FULL_45_11]